LTHSWDEGGFMMGALHLLDTTPGSANAVLDNCFRKITCMRKHLGYVIGLLQTLSPAFLLHRTDDQIIVSNQAYPKTVFLSIIFQTAML
jgi:hypothetical protein